MMQMYSRMTPERSRFAPYSHLRMASNKHHVLSQKQRKGRDEYDFQDDSKTN